MTSTTSHDRVLVVEDDPAARLGLAELVGAWGFVTDAAADGEEVLQRIIAFLPSIVISDLVMLRMGGMEFLRALKAEGGDVTVVILTAQGTVETAVEAIKGKRIRLSDQADRAAAAEDPARQDRGASGHSSRSQGAAAPEAPGSVGGAGDLRAGSASTTTESSVRGMLARAARDRAKVNVSQLTAAGRSQYQQSERFTAQAQQALRDRNLIFASTLALELVGR